MILDEIQEAFFKQEDKPYKLEISRNTYHELMKDRRCMDRSYVADREGKLGAPLFGCVVQVVDDLKSPYKWLFSERPSQIKIIVN
ncbi:hypothetical protein [Acinetobacter pittii]|uniref:Uncharacterized protein n=1 Tax=Acinetobacter pittii TaxID=48296 RepID=A0AAE9SBU0_ACIPI|nr:hypothetical protein [Acinetobacter pittii]MCU4644331.1 hypothetical protein [Acinetobacter pittii]PSD77469.1 hypothetical protein C7G49_02165 [Acinetobacter pittii]USU95847.1 hypothetical protein MWH18_06200 [Acinetobacter pittii]